MLERDWLDLLRQPAFVRVVLAAALVLGSHAMHDAFAIIRWRDAGISPAASSVLWSESVAAEVLVFLLLGPWLLQALGRTGALGLAAGAAVVRWGVMAQTADVAALAAIEPLHGLTFALFHLACMRIIADTVPPISREPRRRSMGPSELAGRPRYLPWFPAGFSHALDLPGSGEWPFCVARRSPSSGACIGRFQARKTCENDFRPYVSRPIS